MTAPLVLETRAAATPGPLIGAWIAWTDNQTGSPFVELAIDVPGPGDASSVPADRRRRLRVAADPTVAPLFIVSGHVAALVDGDVWERGSTEAPARERLVRAVERAGIQAFLEFEGDFTVLAIDLESGVVSALRDRIGLRPLYWTRNEQGGLCFSNSLGAVLAMPGTNRTLNRFVMAEYLCRHYANHTETVYEGVFRVPPASISRFRGTSVETRRYWDPLPTDRPVDWLSQADVDRFDEVFEQAVARAMGAGRAGIFLSGGLDSIAVASMAADLSRRRNEATPLALSLAFPPPGDESEVQAGVAKMLDLPQRLVPFHAAVDEDGLIPSALRMGATWPSPMLGIWNPAYARLAAIGSAEGCGRILTGRGGDECLTISLSYAADLILAGDVPGLVRLLRGQLLSYRSTLGHVLKEGLWTHGIRRIAGGAVARIAPTRWQRYHADAAGANLPTWLAPDAALRQRLRERLATPRIPRPFGPGHYVNDIRQNFEGPVAAYDLEETFELGRRNGIHTAHPFWNGDLVDFLFRIPPKILNQPRRAKWLVRDTLQLRFPGLGLDRQKKLTASAFLTGTVAREGPAAWRGVGGVTCLAELGVVDGRLVEQRMPSLLASGRMSDASQAWEIMNLELWARRNVVPSARSDSRST